MSDPHSSRPVKPLQILIVGESRATVAGLASWLTTDRVELRSQDTLAEALILMKTWTPDLILSDLENTEMPLADFIKMTQIPHLVLISSFRPTLIAQAMTAGAHRWVPRESLREVWPTILVNLLCISERTNQIRHCRHELDNISAILDGFARRLPKNHPSLSGDAAFQSLLHNLQRLQATVQSLNSIDLYATATPTSIDVLTKAG